jgi:hypothetical protein
MSHHGQQPSEQVPKQDKGISDEGKGSVAGSKQNDDSHHRGESKKASGSG